jgi:23S rRNA pseudouridine2604 synthase
LALQPGASGLQVLTQDFRVERKLKEDATRIEQEYVIEVSGEIAADGLERLNQRVNYAVLPACKVSWQNETRLRFAVKNPQPGQFVQMCESVGLTVVSMKRIRIGGVSMSKLQPGQWRYLAAKERF